MFQICLFLPARSRAVDAAFVPSACKQAAAAALLRLPDAGRGLLCCPRGSGMDSVG